MLLCKLALRLLTSKVFIAWTHSPNNTQVVFVIRYRVLLSTKISLRFTIEERSLLKLW